MRWDEIKRRSRQSATDTERDLLAAELALHDWRISATADSLEVPQTTLGRAVRRHPDLADKIIRGRPRKS